ncbi:MAG: hypothetical protein AAFV71_03425 [Cyanobacteria bacterium J06633_8]
MIQVKVIAKVQEYQVDSYTTSFFQRLSKGGRIMKQMYLGNLTEEDRKRNEYLDSINRAPYFTIAFLLIVFISVFTIAISLAAF